MSNPVKLLRKRFENKRILVVGLGTQGGGIGLVKFLCSLGARVSVTDKKAPKELTKGLEQLKSFPVTYYLGGHNVRHFLDSDVVFKGPSVPWDSPEIKETLKHHIPVEMETALFASLCPAKIIGITGTRGKSTTTSLIYEVLKARGISCHLTGNISDTSTINILDSVSETDWVVMELSSWQLSGFHSKKISPHIGVFTNIYPDHFNYYRYPHDYLYDKKAIYLYQKQGDILIANTQMKDEIHLDHPLSNVLFFSAKDFPDKLLYLNGDHNKENAAAALLVSRKMGIPDDVSVPVITAFSGLPFRQQTIGRKGNIIFINDSTSTTPIATIKSIESFKKDEIILLLGGNSKRLPYDDLLTSLRSVKDIILLKGNFTDELLPHLKKLYPNKVSKIYDDLTLAVREAYRRATQYESLSKTKKKVVLLSPGATSFSMFRNEFHRAEEFSNIVTTFLN